MVKSLKGMPPAKPPIRGRDSILKFNVDSEVRREFRKMAAEMDLSLSDLFLHLWAKQSRRSGEHGSNSKP